jgi:nucleotide-binding universal stress UspA family protein
MMRFKRILVPTNFSKESDFALQGAIQLAKEQPSAVIYLLHVLPCVVDAMYLTSWTDDVSGLRWHEASKELAAWKAKIPNDIAVVELLKIGPLSERIALACKENDIDLVVMTSNERRGLARIFHHNVSEEVVRVAPCPVLVLHMNKERKEREEVCLS